MKIGVVFKGENKKARELASKVNKFLKDADCEVLGGENLKGVDYVITLGGDGTLIHKACELASLNVPFVGINTGRLGFLTAAESSDWENAVKRVVEGKVIISERIALEARVEGRSGSFRAVNEFAIKSQFRVVDLDIRVGGEDLLKVSGDGVIVATQSGSTAYSLSAGGPIVDPDLDCLLVTPINPMGLPIPSIVFSPDVVVQIKVMRGEDVSLVIDGQENLALKSGDVVVVKRLDHKIKFGYFDKHHFLRSLKAKFGLDARRVGD